MVKKYQPKSERNLNTNVLASKCKTQFTSISVPFNNTRSSNPNWRYCLEQTIWIKIYHSQPPDTTFENIELSFCVLKRPLRRLSIAKQVTVDWAAVFLFMERRSRQLKLLRCQTLLSLTNRENLVKENSITPPVRQISVSTIVRIWWK